MAELTLLYDEGCTFCTRVAFWLAEPGRLAIAPIGSPLGSVLLRDLTATERYATLHVIDALGRRSSGGSALAPLARTFRGGGPLAVAFDAFPGATDRAYALVARNRSILSRLVTACQRDIRS